MPCPPPGDLPNPGIKPTSPKPPALAGRFSITSATWEAQAYYNSRQKGSSLESAITTLQYEKVAFELPEGEPPSPALSLNAGVSPDFNSVTTQPLLKTLLRNTQLHKLTSNGHLDTGWTPASCSSPFIRLLF